jgi:predicted acyltransferase
MASPSSAAPSATPPSAPTPPAPSALANERIMSIDALRGFDMFWIIGGNGLVLAFLGLIFHPLPDWLKYHFEHPQWQGFSAWDLIMPLFLFIVGVSMPLSFSKRIAKGQGRGDLYKKIVRRVIILFIFGMAAQGHLLEFDLSKLHIYCNTLQAIAVGYLIACIVMISLPIFGQFLTMVALLVAYWLLMTQVPFSGHAAGTLEPDANLALFLDELILGRFRDGTSYTWILSGLGFAATVLIGVLAGHLLRSGIRPIGKVLWLVVAAAACLAAGYGWEHWLEFQIIKHLWTSSMVLWAGGWSLLLMAIFYGVIDVAGLRKWAFPFVVIGMNAITVYMAVHLVAFGLIADNLVGGLTGHLCSFGAPLRELARFMIIWTGLFYMYRNRTFLRI